MIYPTRHVVNVSPRLLVDFFWDNLQKADFSPPGVFNIGGQRGGPKRNGFPIKALNCSNVFNDYLWAERKGLKLKPTDKFPRFLLANAACLPDVRLPDVRKVLPNTPKGLGKQRYLA